MPDRSNLEGRLRREGYLLLGSLAFGFLILPALIFATGQYTLGAYGEDGGLFAFYGDLYGRIGRANLAAWVMLTGPYLLITLCRLLITPLRIDKERRSAH